MKKISGILLGLILLCGCAASNEPITPATTPPAPQESVQPTVNPDFHNENPADLSYYEGFEDQENAFVEISLEETLTRAQNKETFMVFFSRPSCPWCIEAISVLNESAKEAGTVLYYVDMSKKENYSDTMFEELMTLFKGWLYTDEEGEEAFFIPQFSLLVEGAVTMNHISTVETHDPYTATMNEKEKAELKQIYTGIIEACPKIE